MTHLNKITNQLHIYINIYFTFYIYIKLSHSIHSRDKKEKN